MIATGLTFLFGVLVTLLIVLLIAPIVWRKAQSLARRDYEATIPASANEIRAEFDTVRAAAAMSVRQNEILTSEAREKVTRAQAQLGRSTVENVEILKRNRSILQITEERAAEIERLTSTLATRDEENQTLTKTLGATRREADLSGQELAALAVRFEELGEIAEERKIQLVAAEAKLDRLGDAQRVTERLAREHQATIDRLRGEIATVEQASLRDREVISQLNDRIMALLGGIAERDAEIERLSPNGQIRRIEPVAGPAPERELATLSPAETPAALSAAPSAASATIAPPAAAKIETSTSAGQQGEIQSAGQRLRAALAGKKDDGSPEATRAEIQDRISDIAAKVIRTTAAAQGRQSPLNQILSSPPGDIVAASGSEGRAPTLADRVRRLGEAEPNKGPTGRSTQSATARRE